MLAGTFFLFRSFIYTSEVFFFSLAYFGHINELINWVMVLVLLKVIWGGKDIPIWTIYPYNRSLRSYVCPGFKSTKSKVTRELLTTVPVFCETWYWSKIQVKKVLKKKEQNKIQPSNHAVKLWHKLFWNSKVSVSYNLLIENFVPLSTLVWYSHLDVSVNEEMINY